MGAWARVVLLFALSTATQALIEGGLGAIDTVFGAWITPVLKGPLVFALLAGPVLAAAIAAFRILYLELPPSSAAPQAAAIFSVIVLSGLSFFAALFLPVLLRGGC